MNKTEKINYILTRKNVKNINLRITPKGVFVSASNRVSLAKIEEFVESKREFILNAVEKVSGSQVEIMPTCEYNSGDSFKLLGKQLAIMVIPSSSEGVTFDDSNIFLHINPANVQSIKRKKQLIDKWRTAKCEQLFGEISRKIHPLFAAYNSELPIIKLRDMTSRWGSCHTKSYVITLNKKLLEVPPAAIEYVVLHEYAHFIVPNHSKQFYDLIASYMPDYKLRKSLLLP